MRYLKTIAIATIATFGIGGAVIASNSNQTPNVQNMAPFGEDEDWQPITPGHKGCDNLTSRACVGYQETPTSPVTILSYGDQNP